MYMYQIAFFLRHLDIYKMPQEILLFYKLVAVIFCSLFH